jgi:integrase
MGDRPHLMLQWHDPETGQRKSKSAQTCNPLEAEERRADLEYELNHGLHEERSRMPWSAFRELFEREHLSGRRPATREKYEDVLNLFEELARPARLSSVNERLLSAYVAALRERPGRGGKGGLSPYTIRGHLMHLRAVLGWAAGQKLIAAVPRFPAHRVPRKRPQPVPAESFERLLARAPDDRWRAFLSAGWLAGLRLSEALTLEWEATDDAPYLDLARDRIILPAKVAKADEDQWVPLDPDLRNLIEALPRDHRRVFPLRARDGHLLGRSSVSEYVLRFARRAGVRLSMHQLRKGFGCRYAGRVPAQVLQRLMRHSDIKITMGFYANVDDAVEAAILGDRRNSSRNNAGQPGADGRRGVAPNPPGGKGSGE